MQVTPVRKKSAVPLLNVGTRGQGVPGTGLPVRLPPAVAPLKDAWEMGGPHVASIADILLPAYEHSQNTSCVLGLRQKRGIRGLKNHSPCLLGA